MIELHQSPPPTTAMDIGLKSRDKSLVIVQRPQELFCLRRGYLETEEAETEAPVLLVAVDPGRHQPHVVKTFPRHVAAFDPCDAFGKGHLAR